MFNFQTQFQKPVFKAYDSISSVAEIIDHQLPAYGNRDAIRYDTGDTYATLGFDQYLNYLQAMIRWFQSRRLENKVIATFCKNRLEWDMTALATFYTANTLFPLDTKMNETELRHLLSMNPPDYILVSKIQLPRIRKLLHDLDIESVVLLADLMTVFEDSDVSETDFLENDISIKQLVDNDDRRWSRPVS